MTTPVVVTVKLLVDSPAPCRRSSSHAAAADLRRRGDRGGAGVQVRARPLRRHAGAGRDHVHAHVPAAAAAAGAPPPTTGRRAPVLRGKLVELGTRAPVAGATVTARSSATGTTASRPTRRGHFRLPLPPGAASVSVYAAQPQPVRPGGDAGRRPRSWRSPTSSSAIATTPTRSSWSANSAARRSRASRCAAPSSSRFRAPSAIRSASSRRCRASRRSCRCCRFRSCAAPARARPASCSTARACRCSSTCCRAQRHPPGVHRRDPVLSRAARRRPTAATPAASSTAARRARGPTSTCSTSTSTSCRRAASCASRSKPLGATVTAAARYGYPGFLLGLATNQLSLSYWDYQLRLDGGNARNGWTVFFYGAQRRARHPGRHRATRTTPNPPLTPALVLGFHRARSARCTGRTARLEETVRAGARLRPHVQQRGPTSTVWCAEPSRGRALDAERPS